VLNLQTILKSQGYYTYPSVTAYQRANSLEPVGYVGPKTRQLLDRVTISTSHDISTHSNSVPYNPTPTPYYSGGGGNQPTPIATPTSTPTPIATPTQSPTLTITPTPTDTIPPTIPTNLSASPVSPTQINLTWTASTDNVGVTGYTIYRDGTQVGTSTTNAYSDTGLAPATYYTYTVSAYDAAGNVSAPSSAVMPTTLFLTNNVGILCSPTPDQTTPDIYWMVQGPVTNCVNKDPITWAVGDFTGFYPTGNVSDYQRGVSNSLYGSEAVQFQDDTFGIDLNSDSVLPLGAGSYLIPALIDYEYNKTNPPHPFTDPSKSLVWSIQLQIPTAYTQGPAVAYAVGYVLLQDTKSGKDIWYGSAIFATSGTAADYMSIDLNQNGVGTGFPIVAGVMGVNGAYTSNPDNSAPFQSQPWSGFKSFGFSISYAQMKSTIQALKAKYPSLASLSDDPADYVLLSMNINPEMAELDASQPFGPNVFARMGLSAKSMKVSVQ
jgi:hypothetical protein